MTLTGRFGNTRWRMSISTVNVLPLLGPAEYLACRTGGIRSRPRSTRRAKCTASSFAPALGAILVSPSPTAPRRASRSARCAQRRARSLRGSVPMWSCPRRSDRELRHCRKTRIFPIVSNRRTSATRHFQAHHAVVAERTRWATHYAVVFETFD